MVSSVTVRRPSILGVGVVVWLASELMFFAGFFASYFTLRSQTAEWPPEGAELAVGRTAAATVVLVVSSLTMHVAVQRSERDDRDGAVRWLAVTAALGAVFLVNQVLEYRELEFSPSTHAYGSVFYLMTGFHGLHVLGGLGFMAAVVAAIAGRSSAAPTGPTVTVCAYYWHFVDAVWIAMFLTLYVLR
ncbi:MAG: cytochrome c oxidase, subunit [Ilumatobacteraceae bacterium]|nr:cytochrome c oxidase, subunit [Ilumatobacteraceae bacterium]